MGDSWEWQVADGATIRARIAMPERTESVWLGKRLVSRSAAGGKGADHIVALPPPQSTPRASAIYRAAAPAAQAELTFDPAGDRCTLRIDGTIITPTREPDGASSERPTAIFLGLPRREWGLIGALAFGVLAFGAGPSVVDRLRTNSGRAEIARATTETELTETVRAPDYSIAAHFPSDFESTVDEQGAVITLHRAKKLETIVLISMPRSDLDDPRDLDRIMMKELTAFTPKSGATMSTTITRSDTCNGFPGVTSTAVLSKPDSHDDVSLKVVSCSALRNGRAYFSAYLVPELLADSEEIPLRRIVNATDIFDLPELAASDHGSRAQRPPSDR